MDRIDSIVQIINGSFALSFGIGGENIYGIAEKVKRGDQSLYFVKESLTVQKSVNIDDSAKATLFHFVQSTTSEVNNEQGFGSNPKTTQTSNMSMVVFYSNVDGILTSREMLESFKNLFPSTLTKQQRNDLLITRSVIEIGDSASDKHQIWEDVFTGQKNNLSDNSILVRIDYSVELEFNKSCITVPCNP